MSPSRTRAENRVKITELIESAVTGYQFRDRIEPSADGNVAVLQVKDLKDGGEVRREDLVQVQIEKDITRYSVNPGDVLFLSRGSRLFAIFLADPPRDTIVPNYFYILRPRPVVLPAYLAWFINSPNAQSQLRLVHTGTHMPMVSKSDFLRLHVDVPPLDVQRTIVALDQLSQREQRLSDQLLSKKRSLIEHISARAASRRAGKDH